MIAQALVILAALLGATVVGWDWLRLVHDSGAHVYKQVMEGTAGATPELPLPNPFDRSPMILGAVVGVGLLLIVAMRR